MSSLLINRAYPFIKQPQIRQYYWKFKRVHTPPLREPRESPYIVGPYLKPDYAPVKYLTDPIKHRDDNDLDYFIFQAEKVEADEARKVKLLLTADIEGLGVTGQIVETSFRHGASKLIAMKKAEYATEFALSWYKFGPKTFESASSALSQRTARLLRTQIFDLPLSSGVTVQPWHISLALRLSECICPIEAIERDSIKEFNDEEGKQHVRCIVKINNHERVEVKFAYAKKLDEN